MVIEILLLIFAWIAFTIFHFQNLYMIKLGITTLKDLLTYGIWNIPLHFIGFMLIVWTHLKGYSVFGGKYWALVIAMIFIQRTNNVVMTYLMLNELPARGTLIGLILVLIAAIISVIWK